MKKDSDDHIHKSHQSNRKIQGLLVFLLCTFCWTLVSGKSLPFCPYMGEPACDDVCNEIGDDPSDETDIDEVNPAWFASCIRVHGTLFINEDTDLSEVQLIMEPGSEIVVRSGYRLTLSSSVLIAGCEQLWRGIRLEDGATFHTYYSSISGANAAIYLGNRCTLFAWYTTFKDNYIGIASAMPYDAESNPKGMGASLIIGCDFVNTDVLRTPYVGHYYYPDWPVDANIPYDRDFAAIYLRNTSGLNVGLNNPEPSTRNSIDGLRNGIVIDELSTVDVGYCDISNLLGTKPLSSSLEELTNTGVYLSRSVGRIHENTINQVQDGIVCITSNVRVTENHIVLKNFDPVPLRMYTRGVSLLNNMEHAEVIENDIEEGNVGVYVEGGFTAVSEITDNWITSETDGAGRIGIQVQVWKSTVENSGLIENNNIEFEDLLAGVGIWLNLALHLEVFDNNITFLRENEGDAVFTTGIRTNVCEDVYLARNSIVGEGEYANAKHHGIFYEQSLANRLFCNEVTNFSRGYTGSGLCPESRLTPNIWGPTNVIGLELRAPTRLGEQNHGGNSWVEEFEGSYAAYISGPDPLTTAEQSPFIVQDDNICDLWPCPIEPLTIATTWFVDLTGASLTCESSNGPIELTDEDYEDYLLHPGAFEDFGDEMTWMTKAWIFDAILSDVGLLENDRLDSFYNADDAEPLGVLVLADAKMHQHSSYTDDLVDVSGEIMDSLAVVVWIDEELFALSPDSNILRLRRENSVDTILVRQAARFDYLYDTETERTTALGLAFTALSSLSTDTDFEEFYRRILLYELEWKQNGLESLSAGDWEEVQEIATLCTWEGGRAASVAQALCAAARDSVVEPVVVCTGVNPRNTIPSSTQSEMVVYPNPSNTGWTVLVPVGTNQLRLTDMTGIERLKIVVNSSSEFIDASTLPAGAYLLRAERYDQSIVSSSKIILYR
jgi:hypothetical protein